MSLAQRVRDYRYSKGWGPDELASRAAISRTALYQIESGKTELPRAGTLRRIAMALDVSMESLLGHTEPSLAARSARAVGGGAPGGSWGRGSVEWFPAEGAPMATPAARASARFEPGEVPRFGPETAPALNPGYEPAPTGRERELVSKFRDLLATPFGEPVSRIVEETHRLLPQPVAAATAAAAGRVI
jgi:DNA-binding XRE family transcriptional regulator